MHQKKLKEIPVRILVNGTRGKTTVSRLLVSSLNAKGIRTLGRTTGSDAEIIFPDGHVEPFVRKRKATILEMKSIFRIASKEKVQAVVMECMALSPENQRALACSLVKPTHVVITNSFIDHVAEMGPTLEETVYALSQSVPKNAKLYVTEDVYRNTVGEVHVVKDFSPMPFSSPIKIHASGYAVAKELLKDFGIDENCIEKSIVSIKPDIGLYGTMYGAEGSLLVPTFSVNDLTCMDQTVKDTVQSHPGKDIYLIYNNRQDREYRIQLMDKVIRRNKDCIKGVLVIGDYTWKVKTWFSRLKVDVQDRTVKELFEEIQRASDNTVYIGLGNIKGKGEELLRLFLKEERDA